MEYAANQIESRHDEITDDEIIKLPFHNTSHDNSSWNDNSSRMFFQHLTESKSVLEKELFEFELESVIREQKMYEGIKLFFKTYETWRTHRKKTMDLLKECESSIANVAEKASILKLILSTAGVFGSAAFLGTDYLKIIPDWGIKILTASGVIGSVSFLCDVISQYYSKSKVEKIIYLFLLDQDNFEAMNSDKQSKFVSDIIEKNFPFGINDDILKDILACQEEMSAKMQLKLKELERRYQILNSHSQKKFGSRGRSCSITVVDPKLINRFITYDKVSLQEMLKHLREIEMDKENVKNATSINDAKNNEAKIFSIIYLSNVYQKHELLYNTEFIKKARNFSKSTFANLWWKTLENKKSTKQAEKKKLYAEMKSVVKIDKLFWPIMSVTLLPLSHNYTANALAIFVTSSIIAFDAFCELSIKIEPKETRILKRLHRILSSEYKDLKLNKSCSKNQSD
ncbi:uncharacterized protein [Parasteatoda tepidariorum]|uniref:uncharacterized protein n=1 Tax=Parasteatoda tepidariorum TaxID=114398 RepID=UPI00077FBB20|nr:uncharacterized protein LOC107440750 [Parasteatoda tepidariorum]